MSGTREGALLTWIERFAPYGVATLDESLQIRSWNRWMESHSAMRSTDVVGKSLLGLFPDLKERKLVSHFERALQGESSVLSTALHRYLLPFPSTYREFSSVHMLQTARVAPLFAQDKICGVVVVIEDVTQREAQAEALGRQHRRDQLLSWALAHLLNTEQPRKGVRQLFFKIAEHLDFDTFLIYLRDIETGVLRLHSFGGLPLESQKDFRECPLAPFLPPDGNEIVRINSVKARPEPEYAILKKAGVAAALIIPLAGKERNLGLLCFATWSRDIIETSELELVKTIAQYLATALDREATRNQLNQAKEELGLHAQVLEAKVQERTARLQETLTELEAFSYTIAHDLRAPARALSGFCQVLFEDFAEGMSEDAKFVVKRISRASRRMEDLTRDLLEFSKVSRQEIVLARVPLGPVIEDILALRSSTVRRAITIVDPLHDVQAHRGLLQQALSNLIDNAVKFVEPHAVPKITISTEPVSNQPSAATHGTLLFSAAHPAPVAAEDSTGHAPGQIRIWVRDEGIGIPPEARQKIFGIFERGVRSEMYEGTGMGLAIVARATQRMGGSYGVESEPGEGSQFWIELPSA